ncbi:MAG: DUF2059 domain-containing protein [Pseudomonadota bacterium]
MVVACSVILSWGSALADDEKQRLARQLFELVNADQLQQIMTEPLVKAVRSGILKNVKKKLSEEGIELADDKSEELGDFIGQRYRVLMDEAGAVGKERLVAHYVETFSEDELHELTAAYQLPAMRRMLDLTPGWTTELTQLGEAYGRDNINRVLLEPMTEWLDANVYSR